MLVKGYVFDFARQRGDTEVTLKALAGCDSHGDTYTPVRYEQFKQLLFSCNCVNVNDTVDSRYNEVEGTGKMLRYTDREY